MAVTTSMVTRSFQAKKNAAIGAISVSIAKQRNDVLYAKLIKYRGLWKDTVEQIKSKYSSAAMSKWAKNQAK